MSDRINTLDELLSDPMVLLVMERDRVRPEQVRLLLERARRAAGKRLPTAVCRRRMWWPRPARSCGCAGKVRRLIPGARA